MLFASKNLFKFGHEWYTSYVYTWTSKRLHAVFCQSLFGEDHSDSQSLSLSFFALLYLSLSLFLSLSLSLSLPLSLSLFRSLSLSWLRVRSRRNVEPRCVATPFPVALITLRLPRFRTRAELLLPTTTRNVIARSWRGKHFIKGKVTQRDRNWFLIERFYAVRASSSTIFSLLLKELKMRKDKKRRRWPQEIGLYGGEEPSERERVFRVRGIERGGTGSFPFISISPSLSLSMYRRLFCSTTL